MEETFQKTQENQANSDSYYLSYWYAEYSGEVMTVPIDELYHIAAELNHLISNEEYVLWVGSGLSKPVGYPTWEETINSLCLACGVQCPASQERKGRHLIEKAEECKRANAQMYKTTLAGLFGGRVYRTRAAYELLLKLPFKAYVTTNFDPLLSREAAIRGYNNLYAYPDIHIRKLYEEEHPIFYIHGLARHGDEPRGDNLVLATSDFQDAYDGAVRSFLDPLLQERPILFMGCRLDDEYTLETFQRAHKFFKKIRETDYRVDIPRRYILLPEVRIASDNILGREDNFDEYEEHDEEERLRAMGISSIKYEPIDESHSEIEKILEYILEMRGEFKPPLSKSSFSKEVM